MATCGHTEALWACSLCGSLLAPACCHVREPIVLLSRIRESGWATLPHAGELLGSLQPCCFSFTLTQCGRADTLLSRMWESFWEGAGAGAWLPPAATVHLLSWIAGELTGYSPACGRVYEREPSGSLQPCGAGANFSFTLPHCGRVDILLSFMRESL